MPLIVDEVVITVEVTNAAAGGASPAAGGGGGGTEDKQALISECVEQVMELLRQREER
ncbi:hypothetical protein MYSTI_05996 [Myxococcus stipitatus DSM 14675]|uniref:Uncharacterized protein n=1 Tax=Myxococcus stipitatus (strain DSM 14675 / JCM 12634 / Mx s8) TaxID=1278073 RepID=L7ULD4_MYXSD|nr:DUF5908 family protein [Myxococcus stipitatus]AGC47269.1 hypothetical protein MYSTI_05996 [Myxococcus stipitatus DSM 14675]